MSVPSVHISCPRVVLFPNWCHHTCPPIIVLFIYALFSLSHCLYCLYVINLQVYIHAPNFKTQVKVKFCLFPLNSMWQGSQSHQPTISCEPNQPPCDGGTVPYAGCEVDEGVRRLKKNPLQLNDHKKMWLSW